MAVALQAHGMFRGSGAGGTSGNFDTTTGSPNLLVVFLVIQGGSGAPPSFSDNQSNSYTMFMDQPQSAASDHLSGGGGVVIMYYVKNPTTSATHTFSDSQGGQYFNIMWATFSGIDVTGDPIDNHLSTTTASGSNTVLPVGPISNTSGELIITGVGSFAQSAALSIDSSFTILEDGAFIGSTSYGGGLAYKIGTGASETPTWTFDANQPWFNAMIATFKAAAGGGGATAPAVVPQIISF